MFEYTLPKMHSKNIKTKSFLDSMAQKFIYKYYIVEQFMVLHFQFD